MRTITSMQAAPCRSDLQIAINADRRIAIWRSLLRDGLAVGAGFTHA
jgi:hypothetical protein